jgi:hypothetical protein
MEKIHRFLTICAIGFLTTFSGTGVGTQAQTTLLTRKNDDVANMHAARTQAMPLAQSTSIFRTPAVYDSGGQQAVTLAVVDLNGDQVPDIAVVNYTGSVNGDGTVGILLGNGNGTFRPAAAYDSGGGGPTGIAVGDLNGDDKPDLVVANQGCPGLDSFCVGVLLGNGDGTFRPVAVYPVGGRGWGGAAIPIMIADVNSDGKPDLVVVQQTDRNSGDGVVSVLLGNGDGTFKPAMTYDSGGFNAFAGAVADVNGDGKPDVVVFNCVSTGPSDCLSYNREGIVGVLLGNGDGTFQPVKKYGSGGVTGISSPLVVADVNGDRKPDILVGNWCPNNNCSTGHGSLGVLLGNGDGTFQPAATYDPGKGVVTSIAVADLNGDGKLDVAFSYGVGVFLGNGDGTFQPATVYPGGGQGPIFVADVNHDGKLDLVATNSAPAGPSNSALVFLGNGDGTFQAAQNYQLGGAGGAWAVLADVNNDKKPDLIAASTSRHRFGKEGGVGVLVNTSHLATSTTLASSLNPSAYGQNVTWTSTVSTAGTLAPSGEVSYTWQSATGTNTIGTTRLNQGDVATLNRRFLDAGTYPITATYLGDTSYFSSASPAITQTVLPATTVATISSSPNPSTLGQSVKFTARFTSPTIIPTGSVTFEAGTTVLGTAQLSSGNATLTTSTLPLGSTVVKVTYDGNSNINGSSASLTERVQP